MSVRAGRQGTGSRTRVRSDKTGADFLPAKDAERGGFGEVREEDAVGWTDKTGNPVSGTRRAVSSAG